MKLDYDLVRDIMLTIEGMEAGEFINASNYDTFPLLSERNAAEIVYTLYRLVEAGYIPEDNIYNIPGIGKDLTVTALTWQGHQYLNHVRNKNILDKAVEKFPNLHELPVNVMLSVLEKFLENTVGL